MSVQIVLEATRPEAPSREDKNSKPISPSMRLAPALQGAFGHLFPAPPLQKGALTPDLVKLMRTTTERIEKPRQDLGVTDLVPLGPTLALTKPRGVAGPTADWIAYPAVDEPWVKAGQFFIPNDEQVRLRKFTHHGLEMDDVYIVHQLPQGTLNRYGVTDVPAALLGPPPSQQTVRDVERLSAQASTLRRPIDLTGPAIAGGIVVGAAGLGLAAVAGLTLAALGGLAIGMDPIILGVISTKPHPQPGDPVFLYLLSMYVWQKEGYDVIHVTQ